MKLTAEEVLRAAGEAPAEGRERVARSRVRSVSGDESRATTPRGQPVDVVAVVASERLARDGGVLDLDGGRTDRFERNPVVLFSHQTADVPVGKAAELWRDGGELLAGIVFHRESERSELVAQLFASGFLRAFSVSFRVLAMADDPRTLDAWREKLDIPSGEQLKWVATRWELLEVSVSTVPSDPSALAQKTRRAVRRGLATARAHGVDTSSLDEELRRACRAGDEAGCRQLSRREDRHPDPDIARLTVDGLSVQVHHHRGGRRELVLPREDGDDVAVPLHEGEKAANAVRELLTDGARRALRERHGREIRAARAGVRR